MQGNDFSEAGIAYKLRNADAGRPSLFIEPARRRGDAVILIRRRILPAKWWPKAVPPAVAAGCRTLDVYTCADADWSHDTPASGRRMRERGTTIFFCDRHSFRWAYRAARELAGGFPAWNSLQACTYVLLAPAHRQLGGLDLYAAHNSQDAIDLLGGVHARAACRCCGATEHAWEEPDLCLDCFLDHREPGRPAGGFGGFCDAVGCGAPSEKLRLLPLTQFAVCPACQRRTRSERGRQAILARAEAALANDAGQDAAWREEAARG